MKTQKQLLMRHFSAVFRNRANSNKELTPQLSPVFAKYLSRKDLIGILKTMYQGKTPSHLNLAEIENADMLRLIADDLFIIAYITNKWCEEFKIKSSKSEKEVLTQDKQGTSTKKNQTKK